MAREGGAVRAVLDKAMGKVASRKLWAWLSATVALFAGALDGHEWVVVTAVYIGTQGAIDAIARLR